MRTITAAQQAVLNSGVQAEYVRVQVKDAGGTWRDLTTYGGFNAVKSVSWSDNIEQPHATFDIDVFREQYRLSLSPYVEASALNHAFDPSTSYAALIAVNRELKVEGAIVAMDTAPSSGDWFVAFHGRIDTLDTAKDETIGLTGRAILSGRLAQQYIKQERVYSFAADGGHAVALRVWEPNQVYSAGEYMLPASRGDTDPGLNKFLKIHTPGTSGLVQPVWTTGAAQADGTASWDYVGAPTSSGNPVEQVIQNILDVNKGSGDPTVTLYTPTSPSWAITEFIQSRGYTFDAIIALANQIGWTIRSKWRAGTAQFELTLYTPNRSSPSVDFTFGPSDYGKPSELSVDIATIRNGWVLFYGDASDTWPDGTPKRKRVEVSDSTSIAKYGELWAEIQEDQSSQINSSTEANAEINAALSDCKEPTAQLAVPLVRGFPWVELNDFYTFSANEKHFDSDQSLAVTSFSHACEGGKGLKTRLALRGKPTIGARAHIGRSQHIKNPPKFQPHQFQHFNGAKTPTPIFRSIVGGHRIEMAQTFTLRQLAEEYEHHVYTAPGSTLDSTTLKAVSRDRVLELGDLLPAKTYYHRVVPRFRDINSLSRGQPSAEQSFVAGQAAAGHIFDGIALGDYPLNGGFETRLEAGGMPDHWTIFSGTYGVNFVVMEDGNGISGGRYMKLTGTSSVHSMQSASFPIVNEGAEANRHSGIYRFTVWFKNDPANVAGNLVLAFKYYDYQGNLIIAGSTNTFSATTKLGHWQKIELIESVDVTTAVRSVQLAVARSGSCTVYVDDARSAYLGTPWYLVGDTTHFTDAYEAIPNFANGWLDAGPDDPDCIRPSPGMRRSHLGEIELQGRAKSGSVGDVPIWTLPESMWPITTRTFVVSTDQGPGELEVQSCGDVCLRAGGNGFVDLTGVRFFPKF